MQDFLIVSTTVQYSERYQHISLSDVYDTFQSTISLVLLIWTSQEAAHQSWHDT